MKLLFTVVVLALSTSASHAQAPGPSSAMPWLHGFGDARITDAPSASGPRSIDEIDAECSGALSQLELVADVAPAPGNETVTASLAFGVTVRDREHRLVATAPGYACEGSADEVTALAVGKPYLEPTIALSITRGGRRELTTDLVLFRVGTGGRLEAVFTGEVERQAGDSLHRGLVWLIPNGLVYLRPGGWLTLWMFDPVARVYRHRGFDDGAQRTEQPQS